MPTKTKKIKKSEGEYHLSITIGGTVYDFETDDLVRTLLDFTPNAMAIKSKVLFQVSKGDKKFERMVLPRLARRYFVTPNFAKVFAGNIIKLLS